MSLVENGTGMTMPVVPMYGGNGGNGNNNDNIGDGWWIILLLLAMNGWGNNNGGFGGGGNGGGMPLFPYFTAQNTDAGVQRGFDTAAITGQLSGIQSSISNGFAGVEVSACNKAMDQMKATYDSEIASMNQRFGDTIALTNQLNTINGSLQNCCCENRAGIADLKYTVATENCADRAALDSGLRDVLTAMTAGFQSIKDQLCQDKIDAKNDEIAQLRQENLYARGQASQIQQNQQIVDAIYNRLDTCPVGTTPVYGRTPIFTCNQNQGCGCGCNGSF